MSTPSDRALRALAGTLRRLPTPLRGLLAGARDVNDRGVALDPEMQVLLAVERRVGRGLKTTDPTVARTEFLRSIHLVQSVPLPCPTEPHTIAGRPTRLYRCRQPSAPLLIFFHGGGWVVGDLDSHDVLCRRLCVEGGVSVLSVDWRLAPEHPFPAGLDDAVAVFRAVRTAAASLGADPDRVGVGGDSAGGNISAAACLVLRDAGGPLPAFQVLLYPATDFRRGAPSHRLFGEGYLLTTESLDWYQLCYAPPDILDPRASPLLAADHGGLPPAVIATAGFDPLRDEGEQYAEALRAGGVAVTCLDEAGLVHGYAQLDGAVAEADEAVRRLCAAVAALALPGV